MNNKLTIWYDIEKRESIKTEIKKNIQRRYGLSDGEFVSIGGGFKFLYDDETGGHIAVTFIDGEDTTKVTIEGTWSWEVIEVYTHCLPRSIQDDPV